MTQIEIMYEGNLNTRCIHSDNGQEILTSAPKDNQGTGMMFSPTDLLATALGSCVLTIMGIMAQKLKVDITGTKVTVTKEMAHAPSRRIGKVKVILTSPHHFDPETTKKLQNAAEMCPVHQSLHPEVIQEFVYHWGQT